MSKHTWGWPVAPPSEAGGPSRSPPPLLRQTLLWLRDSVTWRELALRRRPYSKLRTRSLQEEGQALGGRPRDSLTGEKGQGGEACPR